MNKLAVLLLFAVVIAIAVDSGVAIRCYVCNSGDKYQGSQCLSPQQHSGLIFDCDTLEDDVGRPHDNYTYCRKFVQDVAGDYRVVRSCATKGRVGRCIDRTGTSKIKLQYCECENVNPSEPCNDAREASVVSRLVVGITAGIALLSGFALRK